MTSSLTPPLRSPTVRDVEKYQQLPDLNATCEVCGRAADHVHHKWDERLQRNVVIYRREDL